jgi:hypothetical protein
MPERDPFGNEIPGSESGERPTRVRVSRNVLGFAVGFALIAGVAGAVIAMVAGTADDAADKVRGVFSTARQAPVPRHGGPAGLQPGSMLRADELSKALPKVRAHGSRVQTLRIDAQRVSATLLGRDSRLIVMAIAYDGTSTVAPTEVHPRGIETTPISAVTSIAPSRAIARAAAKMHRPATAVDYVVLTRFAGESLWVVYFKSGAYFQASLDGRRVKRLG